MKQYNWEQADGTNLLVESDFSGGEGYIRVFKDKELLASWESLSQYIFEMIEDEFLSIVCDLRT